MSNRKRMDSQITITDLIKPIEEHIGCGYMLWPDGGYFNGNPSTPVKGVLLSWMVGLEAIKKAVEEQCNVIICHEPLFFNEKYELPPYRWLTPDSGNTEPEWHPNRKRKELLLQNKITVFQCHYGLDRFCMYQAFTDAIGLQDMIYDHGWESVFRLKKAMTVSRFALLIKKRLNIAGSLRVAGDTGSQVRKIASLWGGMGLNCNLYWLRRAIDNGADAAVCGEMDEFMMQFAEDAGFPIIETSHRLSEEYGISHYAELLRKKYNNLKIVVNLQGRPFITL
jgi:putative NIF3 family GTP cyclohydrolase 1 type 2